MMFLDDATPRLRVIASIIVPLLIALAARAQEAAPEAARPQEPGYAYQGEKSRDPFIPLTGQGAIDMSRSSAADEEFNPTAVELKGILQTKTSRMAVLRSPTGASYLVKNGKIQDAKRKLVEGYVGIVKETSLVVIGPNNQVTELKLKKDDAKTR